MKKKRKRGASSGSRAAAKPGVTARVLKGEPGFTTKSEKGGKGKKNAKKPRGATVKAQGSGFDWELWLYRSKKAVLTTALVSLIAGVLYLAPTVLKQYPVEKIQILGNTKFVEKEDLDNGLMGYIGDSFFTVNLRQLKRDAETIPWVQSADVHRKWPGIVTVEINERVAIAVWNDTHLISHRGELFKPSDISSHQNLPRLYGDGDFAQQVMARYQEVTQLMRPLGLGIVRLELAPRMSWSIQLNNGIELFVDRTQSIEKLRKFAALYDQLKDLEPKVAKVDLRYRNGMAVTWQEGS